MKTTKIVFQILCSSLLIFEALCEDISSSLRRSACGGSLVEDSSSISYPGVLGESLIPGESCVWIIHLKTTRNFRIQFTDFDVNASNSSCVDGAVRLYSPSNLVPSGKIEEYSFCAQKPPEDYFFLGENVAVLVLHVGPSNTQPGSGFTINWEGNSFDQLRTKHLSSFSSSEQGVITYPVIGTYESSLAATWLISKEADVSSPGTDIQLSKLELESCSNPDPCTCDALILYELNSTGNLVETTRHCSNITSPITTNYTSPNSFLIAFFTDFIASPNTGASGFSMLYYPSAESSPEPTTTEQTTTEEGKTTTELEETTPGGYHECGATFTSSANYIKYRSYGRNERCVWVIRPSYADRINVSVDYFSLNQQGLGLTISTIYRTYPFDVGNTVVNGTGSFNFTANMLVVTFYSGSSSETGEFQLSYRMDPTASLYPNPSSEIIHTAFKWPNNTYIKYPPKSELYQNNALAAFIYTPEFRFDSSYNKFGLVREISMEPCAPFCCDALYFFEFSPSNGSWQSHPNHWLCESSAESDIYSKDMLLFIFLADGSNNYGGFDIGFCVY